LRKTQQTIFCIVKQDVRLNSQIELPAFAQMGSQINSGDDSNQFRLGQSVTHPKFGNGVILNHEGDRSQARVQVNFDSVGAKWLMLAYARLEAV